MIEIFFLNFLVKIIFLLANIQDFFSQEFLVHFNPIKTNPNSQKSLPKLSEIFQECCSTFITSSPKEFSYCRGTSFPEPLKATQKASREFH